ncbi:MAG: hypothetical protein PHI11_06890 [Gallionella sp.]|nr:hypothetical protein [Gallionella sp.]
MKIRILLDNGLEVKEATSLAEKFLLLGLESISESANYDRVPKTQMSVRFDNGKTNKMTKDHAHVFARPNGQGKELFAVNIDGSGHDGSSGKAIPRKVGEFLKDKGYAMPLNLVIESMSLSSALEDCFVVFIVYEH